MRRALFLVLAVLLPAHAALAQQAAPTPTPAPTGSPAPSTASDTGIEKALGAIAQGFAFGSYGRIMVGSDLRGSTPEAVNVVAHGSRVVEPSYLETDLYYHLHAQNGIDLTTVTTLAFGDSLFHFTGQFDAQIALRNFYLEAQKDVGPGRLGMWAGSREYRGDDIYLLDYWPLDNDNTVGGGAWFRTDRLEAAVHAGINRLADPFQYQQKDVFTPEGGTATIPVLDRQRYIASAKGTYRVWGSPAGPAVKVKLYSEVQALPSGKRERDDGSIENLPADVGLSVGGQVGLWGFARGQSHASGFLRYSRGLTAFDELDPPMGLDTARKSFPEATELVLGTSGNLDQPWGGVQLGAYSRLFRDADPNSHDQDDGWEYIIDARPRARIVGALEGALDLSWQVRFPRGLDPVELTAMDPAVFQLAPMVVYSPFGPGGYARPQFRLVYRAAYLNPAARSALYPLDDPRRGRHWQHYLGLQAEWWFNSTYRN